MIGYQLIGYEFQMAEWKSLTSGVETEKGQWGGCKDSRPEPREESEALVLKDDTWEKTRSSEKCSWPRTGLVKELRKKILCEGNQNHIHM